MPRPTSAVLVIVALLACGGSTPSDGGPGPVVAIELSPPNATLAAVATQQFTALGRRADDTTAPVTPVWTATGGTVTNAGLYTAGSVEGDFRVIATVGAIADTAPVTITSVAPPTGTLLFSENFDAAGFTGRGWYDIGGDLPTSTVEVRPAGGTRSLQWQWTSGNTNPSPGSAARHLFTPTDRVYLRYWVKYSTNWVGSGQSSHPHEFNFLTTEDNAFVGPAFTKLTAYVEHNWRVNGGFPVVGMQDGANINQSQINVNLVGVSENRSAHGCNGFGDAYSAGNACYLSGSVYYNGRSFGSAASPLWTDNSSAASYKSNWHMVEAYFQLNTIAGGIGQADGIIRYWFDGTLILDLPGVLMRTGRYPTMQFNQLLLGPYIGAGSPVTQTAWIDDVVVATGRIP